MDEKVENQNLSEVAIKNTAYSFSSILVSKIGSLIFTIIIARLLLPELFGIYSLALSVVLIAITFTDLGVDSAAVRYISDALGKNKKGKARSYFRYLFKIKLVLISFSIFIILLISKYLAYEVFQKPLVLFPLLFACLYILIESLRSFLSNLFTANKNLKPTPFLEAIYQFSKIFFSLSAVLLLADNFKVSGIFVSLGISGGLFIIASLIILIKKYRDLFFGKTEKIEKPRLLKYIGFMGVANLSLVFFASVDTLILGRFVEASYIGYYRAAISLVLTFSALISFSGILLPIFTQIHKKRLERGFQKTLRYILMFSIPIFLGLVFLSKYLIKLVYGPSYLTASLPIYILSLIVLTAPLISLYSTLFASKEKAKALSKLVFVSLIINIVLNFLLIKHFVTISQEHAIIGAAIATVISRTFLLISISIKSKKYFKIPLKNLSLSKFLLGGLIMSIFLIIFNHFIDLNIFFGALEVLIGATIYFSVLFLTKGIKKEDLELVNILKSKFKRN